jgi:signal transduction histidine kinase
MNRSRFSWWPLPHREGRQSHEAGAALFQGLRTRLTLWYCGVMGAALVLFGLALYFGANYYLLNPVEADTARHAQAHQDQWINFSPVHACPLFDPQNRFGPPPGQGSGLEWIACYDQNGSLLQNQSTTGLPPGFLSNSSNLVQQALRTGQPTADFVDGGETKGTIYRYALPVPGPAGNMGVVMAGERIQDQENTLTLLLRLLLAIGGVALLGAGVGGLFLSNRALAPARLAWANQQRFIADASHELRTPLTLLRADAEVLLRGRKQLDTEDAALLEDIVAEADHMGNLANNLLTLARLDNTSSHREHEVVNLADIALAGTRRIQALADQSGIIIQAEANARALVIGDPAQLEQAVLALLDNAIKYNRPAGSVTLRTTTQQGQAFLEVRDAGIGIAAEHLPHLGERFYRVDKARSREAGGTGLGLSIARGIAQTHGGELTLSSTPGEGTTVTLQLPLVQKARPERVHEAAGSVSFPPQKTT